MNQPPPNTSAMPTAADADGPLPIGPVISRPTVDMSNMRSTHSLRNRLGRLVWGIVWATLFRTSPRPLRKWRTFLLRCFGAKMDPTAHVYPKAKIWAPWNLTMGPHSCLADDVDCYNVDQIVLGDHSVVSQYSYLCAASHDYTKPRLPLTTAPIIIEPQVWVAADVFVAPGIRIGEGTVVGARSNVLTDLPPWKVCVGTPAKPIKDRVLRE